jgi:hypothetical protein
VSLHPAGDRPFIRHVRAEILRLSDDHCQRICCQSIIQKNVRVALFIPCKKYIVTMNDRDRILEELRAFFKNRQMPKQIRTNTYSPITNSRKFVDSHLMIAAQSDPKEKIIILKFFSPKEQNRE